MPFPWLGSMFVSTMKPQPALVFSGYVGYVPATSGRAPSMKTAKPTKICAAPPQFGSTGAVSEPKAARHTDTCVISMSSSAQPVNGMAPVTPVRLSAGVSTVPNGFCDVPLAKIVRLTAIGPGVFDVPVNVNEIAPATLPPFGNPVTDTTLIVRFAGPLPDAGLTCSQGWLDTAVHVTDPTPVCVSRTVCSLVLVSRVAPLVRAPNFSDVRSSVICGPFRFDG